MNKCKDVGVNMEEEELVKMFNLTLKRREAILFILIVHPYDVSAFIL